MVVVSAANAVHVTMPLALTTSDLSRRYLMFDMAGQSVYAVTHQYFLAERAVYMLVWRARELTEEGGVGDSLNGVRNMIEKWTDMLQNRVPGRFLLLATRPD